MHNEAKKGQQKCVTYGKGIERIESLACLTGHNHERLLHTVRGNIRFGHTFHHRFSRISATYVIRDPWNELNVEVHVSRKSKNRVLRVCSRSRSKARGVGWTSLIRVFSISPNTATSKLKVNELERLLRVSVLARQLVILIRIICVFLSNSFQ